MNHFVRVVDQIIDEVRELLGRYANGENGFVLAKEIKIAVVSFQDTPTGMSIFFYSCGSFTDCKQKKQFWKTSS